MAYEMFLNEIMNAIDLNNQDHRFIIDGKQTSTTLINQLYTGFNSSTKIKNASIGIFRELNTKIQTLKDSNPNDKSIISMEELL